MFKSAPSTDEDEPCVNDEDECIDGSRLGAVTVQEGIISQPTEQTALLLREQAHRSNVENRQSYVGDLENQKSNQHTTTERRFRKVVAATAGYSKSAFTKIIHPKSWKTKIVWDEALLKPASYIPSVILGLLLNILDALSYGQYERLAGGDPLISFVGMILFPVGQPIFANLGPDGISMFYVSCIVSQLVYSLGGSIFKGGIGSEMVLNHPIRCSSLLISHA